MNHDAVRSAYPNIITIAGEGNFFDINMNPVVADMSVIEQEAERMEVKAQADAEAKAQLRTSVINKIATNLTSEEKAWLEENL
jgi:hypothetical protein